MSFPIFVIDLDLSVNITIFNEWIQKKKKLLIYIGLKEKYT